MRMEIGIGIAHKIIISVPGTDIASLFKNILSFELSLIKPRVIWRSDCANLRNAQSERLRTFNVLVVEHCLTPEKLDSARSLDL